MASRKAAGDPRRPKRIPGASAEVPPPMFGTDTNSIIPGEVILQVDEVASSLITESIPRGPVRGRAVAATSFGQADLDAALASLNVTSITQLHPPAPVVAAAMSEAISLAQTYRVRFDPGTPVAQAVQVLDSAAGVAYAEPNRYCESYIVPDDPRFASQWGLNAINCPDAWDSTTGSSSVVVAVLDSGIDLDHPELASLLVPGTDLVDLRPSDAPPGFRLEGDFTGVDAEPQDEVGHGTHVAGTIACRSNNGTGVTGVTWNCRLMPVRVLARVVNLADPADVRGSGSMADLAAGIRWAVDHGARVLNLSVGGPESRVVRDAVAYAVANNAVVVAAMGNGGPGAPPSFPAAFPDVVAVGAIDRSDRRAWFSQVGPHIDICAPGVGIMSTMWNDSYASNNGTSMASPHVAGVAALLLSCNPSMTAAAVAETLRQTARPLRDAPSDPVPNDSYGFGCVDARAAVRRVCFPRPLSRPLVTCPRPSQLLIRCPVSEPLLRCPTTLTPCLTRTSPRCTLDLQICRRSALLPCPSGPLCDGPGPGPRPGPFPDPGPGPFGQGAGATGEGGWGEAGWDEPSAGEADPYAGHYRSDKEGY